MKRNQLYFVFLLLLIASSSFAQSSTVNYLNNTSGVTASFDHIPNPERGFYVMRDTRADFDPLQPLIPGDLEYIKNTFEVTLLLRLYYLDKSGPIATEYLTMIKEDAQKLRDAGMKAILRFAYSGPGGTGAYHGHPDDASFSQVLAHIQQLKPVLKEIADVIAVVQAGFIGSYGEWAFAHPDFYRGDPALGEYEKDISKLREVTDSLLSALPEDRMIQVRTPNYKISMYNTGTGGANALQESGAYGGTATARIGHHNDCFVSSYNDYFTYLDTLTEYPYLRQDTRFLPMGGETCFSLNDDNREDCSTFMNGQATVELDNFHWSYLNAVWYPQTIDGWRNQDSPSGAYPSCFEEIKQRLGYRFELQTGTYSPTILDANCPFNISIVLKNKGYAAPFNPRDVELVLVNQADPLDAHTIQLTNQDPRFWFKEREMANIIIQQTISIPAGISDGTYDLFLNLPDPEPNLRNNPKFSIQLANTGVWQETTGYNDLKQSITISSAGNVAPELSLIDAPIDPQLLGSTITASADFTDACDTDLHTAGWDWGDGTISDAGVVDQANNSVTGSHIYTAPGVYTVTLTLTDSDGGVDTETFEFVVVYDPSAGFVTGGGWIQSPPEACPDFCGGATGKANFGFVSKYKKGATIPTGNTQFQFKSGGLDFHSTDYEWLVIAGAKAMFKGSGTINGSGDYQFQVSAVDGQLSGGDGTDRFRIKIVQNGGGVVYDNQFGADDNEDPVTTLGGGSIKIHQSKTKGGNAPDRIIKPVLPTRGYALLQNFPNPFNETTVIPFRLPETTRLSITVYNTTGRLVATLIDGEYSAGQHQVELEAGQLPPGLYMYHMQAGDFQATRRLLLMK